MKLDAGLVRVGEIFIYHPTSSFSVYSVTPWWMFTCDFDHHRDTKNTEDAQRISKHRFALSTIQPTNFVETNTSELWDPLHWTRR